MGLPGDWIVHFLFMRATAKYPAGPVTTSPSRWDGATFDSAKPARRPESANFRGCHAVAHVFACLRIAGHLSMPVAGLATDPLARL